MFCLQSFASCAKMPMRSNAYVATWAALPLCCIAMYVRWRRVNVSAFVCCKLHYLIWFIYCSISQNINFHQNTQKPVNQPTDVKREKNETTNESTDQPTRIAFTDLISMFRHSVIQLNLTCVCAQSLYARISFTSSRQRVITLASVCVFMHLISLVLVLWVIPVQRKMCLVKCKFAIFPVCCCWFLWFAVSTVVGKAQFLKMKIVHCRNLTTEILLVDFRIFQYLILYFEHKNEQ